MFYIGAIAQLVERFVRIEEVVVSITISSTKPTAFIPPQWAFLINKPHVNKPHALYSRIFQLLFTKNRDYFVVNLFHATKSTFSSLFSFFVSSISFFKNIQSIVA